MLIGTIRYGVMLKSTIHCVYSIRLFFDAFEVVKLTAKRNDFQI